MGKVITGVAVSLDGFIAGPNDSPDNPLGDGGGALFKWYFSGDVEIPISDGQMSLKVSAESAAVLEEAFKMSGAMVCGRRMFDIAGAWQGHPPGDPCFVVTHHPPQEWVKEGSPFTFVMDGVESAIRQAKKAAGDKNVAISTASITQQCLNAGLLDEISISQVPVLLGGGVRLLDHLDGPVELECTRVVEAPGVTHLTYRVVR